MQVISADRESFFSDGKKPGRRFWWVVLLSVALHVLILAIVDKSVKITKPEPPPTQPINAKLIFVPTPAEPEPVEETVTEPEPVEPVKTEVVEQPVVEEVAAEPENSATEQPVQNVDNPPEQNASDAATSDLPRLSVQDMARQHLGAFQYQQQQRLAEQQAGDFRQQQISPTLPKRTIDPFITEEEKLIESTRVNVDCSSGVNKTIALLSGIAGGVFRCTKPPSLSPYIENRLNKGVKKDSKAPGEP